MELIRNHLIPLAAGLGAVPVMSDVLPDKTAPLQVALALLIAALVRWVEIRWGRAGRTPRRRRTHNTARNLRRRADPKKT